MNETRTASLFESQMAMYASYHRDPRNRVTHFVGIPAIVLAVMVALAPLRFAVGGIELSWAIAVTAVAFALWVSLDAAIGAAMAVFLAPFLVLAEWLAAISTDSAIWTLFAVLFVGGWALQFLGHFYEGRRPAFLSNLFQALIGPMFLMAEIFFALGWRLGLRRRVEQLMDYGLRP